MLHRTTVLVGVYCTRTLAETGADVLKVETENIDAILAVLERVLAKRDAAERVRVLEGADLPAVPVHTLDSFTRDPHSAASGFFSTGEHPTEGRWVRTAPAAHPWAGDAGPPRPAAPRLGEHGGEALRGAGRTGPEIAALFERAAPRRAGRRA